jgi:hypothetical protein
MKTLVCMLVVAASLAIHKPRYPLFDPPGECPQDETACVFSSTYEEARSKFRALAAAAGAELHALPIAANVSGLGPVPDLTIDIALFAAASDDAPTLLHVSGTHGVEAHAGSAVQLALLRRWAVEPAARPAAVRVVLVHALNPFGFHFGRRWNEDSVDLNRNLLDEAQFAAVTAKGEERFVNYTATASPWCDWSTPYSLGAELRLWRDALTAMVTKGYVPVKKALVSGQYQCAECLWYGGRKLAASHVSFLAFLREHVPRAAALILVDVHTGLGRSPRIEHGTVNTTAAFD